MLYLVSSTAECFLSRRYGLRVGAPYGGVCLPKDVPELTSLAPEGSVFREFLSGTGKINEWITNTPNLKVRILLVHICFPTALFWAQNRNRLLSRTKLGHRAYTTTICVDVMCHGLVS